MAKNMIRRPFPRGGISTRLPVTIYRRSVANADAQDWINRVYSNGGTVSSATAQAVNSLCDSLESASLRDRFYRLNLFCGSNLNAALVPLYRGPSLGGTQYGSTTDTNNAFVGIGTDYAETGATGGLKGNGTSKYLDTGLQQQTIGVTGHLSVFARHATYSADAGPYRMIGTLATSPTNQYYYMDTRLNAASYGAGRTGFVFGYGSDTSVNQAATLTGGQLMTVNRSSSTDLSGYLNGSLFASVATSVSAANVAANMYVFAENRGGSALTHSNMTFGAYSMGLSMNATQISAYYAAMSAFQTALSRNSGV